MLSVAPTNTGVQFNAKAPIFSVVLTEFTENYYLQHRLFDRSWKPFEHGMYFFTDWKRNASSIQIISQIARFMELTWGPPGSCRPQGNWSKRRQTETSTTKTSTNRNVDKPKRRQTKTSTDRNVDKPKRRQTETSTNQNVDRPKRRQTKTSTDQNVDKPKRRQTKTSTNMFHIT